MNKVLDAVITHIVSQLTLRWIALPNSSCEVVDVNIHDVSRQVWLQYIRARLRDQEDQCPWIAVFSRHFIGYESYVVDEIIRHLDLVKIHNARFITYYHEDYPVLLREIADPPAALTYIGNIKTLRSKNIHAIVGSRNASPQAESECFNLARLLSNKGHVIVSGGARGIDAAAHRGAISSSTPTCISTIVVMAGGFHTFYPQSNRFLFSDIKKYNGLFLSEKLWRHNPRPFDFPIRNRIVSGLSQKLIIMQASKASGSMTTADLALRQGRDVYVYLPRRREGDFSGNIHLVDSGAPFFESSKEYLNYHFN